MLIAKKSTQQPPEIQMASYTDIKIITGIKLKYLSEKINEYGTNHMFPLIIRVIFLKTAKDPLEVRL